ncbi:MAG: anthranilate synthase component I family protein [Nitrospirota bacterium]
MLSNEARFLDARVPVPLLATIPLGNLVPVDAYAVVRTPSSFLLESGSRAGRGALGRYSFIGGSPYEILTAQHGALTRWTSPSGKTTTTPATDSLAAAFNRIPGTAVDAPPGAPPFIGGVVGCLGYGLSQRHRRGGPCEHDVYFPDLQWMFFDLVGAFDHVERTFTASFCPSPERFAAEPRARLLEEGRARLSDFLASVTRSLAKNAEPASRTAPEASIVPGMSREAYCAMVERAKAYIAAGDIFQANLAQRFTATYHGSDGLDVYRRLRAINPAPFAAFVDLGETEVICSSPERLVKVSGREVETRPIAGTRPRGATAADDEDLTADLLLNPKERAEHLMLVDLERNDLGRVCAYGSVKVDELMVTERYSHVIHIVSNIRGLLREGATGLDVLDAVFPGGTVTGVPKIRCMEIIDELEPVSRGLYTGSIGYVSWSGHMDWNIVIRTLTRSRSELSFYTGAGIVADSDPDKEYRETLYKAQALIDAVNY